MGVSTDAILFWGILVDEEWSPEEQYGNDKLDHIYAERACGLKAPRVEWSEETKDQYHVYWDKCREANKTHGIEFGYHCSYDYPMHYFAVAASVTKASRGYPEEITSLEIGKNWRAKLEAYCKVMGLETQEPKWWLVSMWG